MHGLLGLLGNPCSYLRRQHDRLSFTATGSINCKGTALPTAVTLDINVLSWTAGRGGAVRTPTRMQGTYTVRAGLRLGL